MFFKPQTIAEARAHRYNTWAGNPKGVAYREGQCATEVAHQVLFAQCTRKNGHGPDGLYCAQHAKIASLFSTR